MTDRSLVGRGVSILFCSSYTVKVCICWSHTRLPIMSMVSCPDDRNCVVERPWSTIVRYDWITSPQFST